MEEKINFWSHGNNSSYCTSEISGFLFIPYSKLAKLVGASQLTSIIFGDGFLHHSNYCSHISEYK